MAETDEQPNWVLQRNILWAVRIALVVSLGITLAFPDWEQFKGKGMAVRVPVYLLPAFVVPLVWWIRQKPRPYPYRRPRPPNSGLLGADHTSQLTSSEWRTLVGRWWAQA
jgi:hypothetical protein